MKNGNCLTGRLHFMDFRLSQMTRRIPFPWWVSRLLKTRAAPDFTNENMLRLERAGYETNGNSRRGESFSICSRNLHVVMRPGTEFGSFWHNLPEITNAARDDVLFVVLNSSHFLLRPLVPSSTSCADISHPSHRGPLHSCATSLLALACFHSASICP